jgi:hypothetical protein
VADSDPSQGTFQDPPAVIPLSVDDRVVGTIAIFSTLAQKNKFDQVDFELFKLLGQHAAQALVAELAGVAPKAVIAYATMNHDQQAVLEGVRAGIGPGPLLIGCSVQGVVSNDNLTEDGFALGLMGFGGGELQCAVALEREVQTSPKEKGRQLAPAMAELKSWADRWLD